MNRLKVRLSAHVPRSMHQEVLEGLDLTPLYPVLPYRQSLLAIAQTQGLAVTTEVLAAEEPLLRSYVVSYTANETPAQMMARLMRRCADVVECCSPVYVASLASMPNDPRLEEQRMLQTIQAFDAWDVEGGSDTVVIGISDSGVRPDHEDLKDALFTRSSEIPDNGKDDDGNGYVDDYRGYNFCTPDDSTLPGDTYNPVEGHGTGVAGICAAVADNGVGIAGVAGKCKIFPIKTMPNTSSGIVYGYESLMYCAVNNIDVVNCSWGSTGKSCVDESIVRYVIARGTAVVAAAGNHRSAVPFYPGSYHGVLNVGVTDPDDNVIAMSGHGPTVDVMAPGQQTLTTSNDGTYGKFCCTSGSSPIAAAAVALVRSRYPLLSPLQACAIVRESATPQPWKTVESPVNPQLLPYGRLNLLGAVTMRADSLPSIEWDSVRVAPASGSHRWGVGDTLEATLYGTNLLAEWTLDSIVGLRITPDSTMPVQLLRHESPQNSIHLNSGDKVILEGFRCVVTKRTDTTVYVAGSVTGTTLAGEQHTRPFSIAIVPAPAYTTLQNDVVTTSIGDRGRIGNTDIERGQGAGLIYRAFCGQLYEGGLMVAANNRVVDAVRGLKGVNDHFRPQKRFEQPDSSTAIVTDADAPDSLRLGVQVTWSARLAQADSAVIVLDVTLKNISQETLYDPAIGWFCDWDLGSNPGHNDAESTPPEIPNSVFMRASTSTVPSVWSTTLSHHTDAIIIHSVINNASTYAGFDMHRKYALLHGAEADSQFSNVDVASITGVRFDLPLPPGQQRSFRQVFVIDTTRERCVELARAIVAQDLPSDSLIASRELTLGTVYPNPTKEVVTVPIRLAENGASSLELITLQGMQVYTIAGPTVPGVHLVTLDLSSVSSGAYVVRLTQNAESRTILMQVLH